MKFMRKAFHMSWIRLLLMLGMVMITMFCVFYVAASVGSESMASSSDIDRPIVEQEFLQKYDSLTTDSLTDFISDWREWSEVLQACAQDTLVNDIYSAVIDHYKDKVEIDSALFSVLPYSVLVKNVSDDYLRKNRLMSFFKMMFCNKETVEISYVVPSPVNVKPILYLTPGIEDKLNTYLGWIYKWLNDGGYYEEVHYDREAALRRYSCLTTGEIPGRYIHYTFPFVSEITFYRDGASVNVDLSPFYGEVLFLSDNSAKNMRVVSFRE